MRILYLLMMVLVVAACKLPEKPYVPSLYSYRCKGGLLQEVSRDQPVWTFSRDRSVKGTPFIKCEAAEKL